MTRSSIFKPLVLGAAILTAGFAVQAQAQPGPGAQAGPKAGVEGRMAKRDPAEMAARRTEHLRTALQLKSDQEAALKAFVDATMPPTGRRAEMQQRRQEMAKLTTPERLDRMAAMMAEHQAIFGKRAAATKRFYSQLTPSQQKAFDAMGPMRGMGGHERKGMGGGRGDGPGMGPRGAQR